MTANHPLSPDHGIASRSGAGDDVDDPGSAAGMRNVVLIFIDTLRPDHLGCYGYPRATSPFLDDLAARSLVLDACYSASNFTAPAFTSVFTAAPPARHGVFNFFSCVRRSPIKECLDGAGVHTAGIVTFRFLGHLLRDVWDNIEAVTDTRSFDYSKDLARVVSDAACEWLAAGRSHQPFCLFLHYDAPHSPYRLPDRYAELFDSVDIAQTDKRLVETFFPQHLERLGSSAANDSTIRGVLKTIERINYGGWRPDPATLQLLVDKYDASIRYNDDMIARVHAELAAQGLLENTIVAVFSDHGEEFLEHGHLSHGGAHLYEEIIRTVGIIHDPTRPEPRRCGVPFSHVQILPTLLAQAGLASLPASLARLDFGATAARRADGGGPEPVFCVGEFKTAVRLEDLKWIRARPCRQLSRLKRMRLWLRLLQIGEWRDEVYDLSADPGETGRPGVPRQVARALRQQLAGTGAVGEVPASEAFGSLTSSRGLDEAERARIEEELRRLGYM
jgi:arylsulfatase A-like enzyme